MADFYRIWCGWKDLHCLDNEVPCITHINAPKRLVYDEKTSRASVEGAPGVAAWGASKEQAVGNLICKYPHLFKISL